MRHVLICDAEPMFRYGLAHQLARRGWTASVAEAGTVAEAIASARKAQPAVIVADAVLPDGPIDGLLADPSVRSAGPRVIVVPSDVHSAPPRAELVHAVLPRHTGVERLIRTMGPEQEDGPCLPERQRQVLALVCRGWSNRSIAEELGIREKSVRNCLTRAFRSLSVQNRTQAALHVLNSGLRPVASSAAPRAAPPSGDDRRTHHARPTR